MLKILEKLENQNIGFEVTINKKIKTGKWFRLGAASAAGAAFGANELLGNIFSNEELVHFAMFGEELASGSRHADNIAPCLFGGITLVKSSEPIDIFRFLHQICTFLAVHPQVEVKNSDARQILKKKYPNERCGKTMGKCCRFGGGDFKNDNQLISSKFKKMFWLSQFAVF